MTLATLKNYLDVTWTDTDTDSKLTGILNRAESVLNGYAGAPLDYSDESTAEAQLLLDCCRYIWNNVFEDFKVSYAAELTMLRANAAAKAVTDGE